METNVITNLEMLCEKKRELKKRRKAYNESVKGLVNEIHDLEAEVMKAVLETGKTITLDGIRAEYKPTVVIKLKREDEKNE